MGPYCKFCGQRCFTHMPDDTPAHIVQAYTDRLGPGVILATCIGGQELEKRQVGYCYNDIKAAITAQKGAQ